MLESADSVEVKQDGIFDRLAVVFDCGRLGLWQAWTLAGLAAMIGFDRERVFYPTVLIAIASYYILFAIMGASRWTLILEIVLEIVVASGFLLVGTLGFKRNLWLVAIALVGHGVFDFVRPGFIDNPGVPSWWPGFCLIFDVVIGGLLALRLAKHDLAVTGWITYAGGIGS